MRKKPVLSISRIRQKIKMFIFELMYVIKKAQTNHCLNYKQQYRIEKFAYLETTISMYRNLLQSEKKSNKKLLFEFFQTTDCLSMELYQLRSLLMNGPTDNCYLALVVGLEYRSGPTS
uniref:Uncharacterized protein n=1 Tax=Trichobilharzia regenti TaxID=157069 RepID=A0AA85JLE6_TRIRE|nr:unnamed protein product [Trichobilharzia regenti]